VEMAGDFEALAAGTVVVVMIGIEQVLDFVVEIVAVETASSAGLD
jgi:hypothetical protein